MAIKKNRYQRMITVLYVLMRVLAHLTIALSPFMPDAMDKLAKQLALSPNWDMDNPKSSLAKAGTPLPPPQALFPRRTDDD